MDKFHMYSWLAGLLAALASWLACWLRWLAGCAGWLAALAGWLRWLACWLRWLAFRGFIWALLGPFIWALGPSPFEPILGDSFGLCLGPFVPFYVCVTKGVKIKDGELSGTSNEAVF